MATTSDSHIVVGCRVRPLNEQELSLGNESVWTCSAEKSRIWHDPKTPYSYDHVFDEGEDNDNVYEKLGQPIISGVLDGFHGTIFAYGQTSSGKTHTLLGTAEEMGVIVHSVHDIFEFVCRAPPEMEFLIRVSYLEIYNEEVKDLLGGTTEAGGLRIIDDPKKGCHVRGLKEVVVLSPDHVFELLKAGEEKRHYGTTKMNYTSSRSHTLFRMIVESRMEGTVEEAKQVGDDDDDDDEDEDDDVADLKMETISRSLKPAKNAPRKNQHPGKVVQVSQLNLVDLAGSERVSKTEATGARLKEGAAINKSLLVLGTVINKLAEGHKGHIPFRDSKLTRLLSNSLGGNAKTAVICTLSPAQRNFEESKSTLHFASRAKTIVNRAVKNHILDKSALLDQYKQEIVQLKLQLASGKSVVDLPELSQVRQKLREEESKRQELEEQSVQDKAALQEMRKLVMLTSKLAANPSVSGQLQEKLKALGEGIEQPKKVLEDVEELMRVAEKEQRVEDGVGEDEKLTFEQLSKILNLKRTKRRRRRLSSLCQNIVTSMAEQRKTEELQETRQLLKDHLNSRLQNIEAELSETQQKLDEAVNARHQAEQKATNSIAQLQSSTEQLQELTACLVERNEQLEALNQQLNEARSQAETLQTDLDQSQETVETQHKEISQLREDIATQKNSLSEYEKRLERAAEQQAKLEKDLNEHKMVQSKNDLLFKQELSEKEASWAQVQTQLESLQLENSSLAADLQIANEGKQQNLEIHEQELLAQNSRIEDLSKQLSRSESQASKFQEALREAQHELKSLESANTDLIREREQLHRANLTAVEEQETQLQGLLVRLETQQSRSRAQIVTQESQLSALQKQVSAYETKIKLLQSQDTKRLEYAHRQHLSQEIQVRAVLLEFADGLEKQIQDFTRQTSQAFSRQTVKLDVLARYIPCLLQKPEEADALRGELDRVTQMCRVAQNQVAILQERQRQTSSQSLIDFEEKRPSHLQQRREQSLVREIEDLKARLNQKERDLQGPMMMKLTAQFAEEMEALEKELARAIDQAKVAEENQSLLQERCIELQLESDRKDADLDRSSRKLQELRQEVNSKLTEVSHAWENSCVENRRLVRQLSDMHSHCQELEESMQNAHKEAEQATETFLAYQRGAEGREAHLTNLLRQQQQLQNTFAHRNGSFDKDDSETSGSNLSTLDEKVSAARTALKSYTSSNREVKRAIPARDNKMYSPHSSNRGSQNNKSAREIETLRRQLDAAHDELDVFQRLDVYSTSLKRGLHSYRRDSKFKESSRADSTYPTPNRAKTDRLLRILQEQD